MRDEFDSQNETNSALNISPETKIKRSRVTPELIARIRKDLSKNLAVKTIAENSEMSLPCAYKIVHKISEGLMDAEILGRKRGQKVKENAEIKNILSQTLLRDSSYTQEELVTELRNKRHSISQSTVSRVLKSMEYTRKRLVRVPEERNSPKNLDMRQTYAREIQFISDSNLVFLDETGVNLHQSRNYGYSPKNVKAFKVVKGNRGQNISTMVAINRHGILAYEIKDGAFDSSSFVKFIEEKLRFHFLQNPNDLLIMDNCKFHHSKAVIDELNSKNIRFKFLPPYSPQLNPIEEYFSHFKAKLSSPDLLKNDRNQLKIAINNLLFNEDISLEGYYNNMRSYITKALARQEFL